MYKKIVLQCLFIFISLPGFSQNKFTISGYVKDSTTGEFLIGTNVYIKELLKGEQTNQYGFYSITVNEGNYTVVFSYVGYREKNIPVELNKNVRINAEMASTAIETKEVEIVGEKKDKNVQNAQMGKIELDVEKIKSLPTFLGEVDILKAIQLLPGVQAAGEGNSGFYVRGGGPDQNLILLDEAVVYNPAHLFGFFSVFNADAVKNISLIKGGMPANYGGRLASVLDISMKEGNSKGLHVNGGIGYVASRLTIEGPLKKDTSSFIISARRTFIDLFLRPPFIKKGSNAEGNSYYFYDLNAKINYRLSDKDRLFLSGYFGRDVFSFSNAEAGFKVDIPWGNATGSLRWNHLFSGKMFLNTSLIFTDYNFSFGASQQEFDFKIFSGIKDYNAKIDFDYFPSIRHHVKFGANYTYHIFTPTNASARSGDVVFDLGDIVKFYAHDIAVYINDDFDISDKLSVNYGLRYSLFEHIGPFNRYILDNLGRDIVDTISYKRGEKVAFYNHIEPRISVKYSLGLQSSLKAAYTQNYQYIHLASVGSVSLPTDVWVPSSDRVKPQFGTQYALGYFKNYKNNMYETSIEVYYKEMKNQIEYSDGHQPDQDIRNNTDNSFVFGKGWSYGAEFFLKKAEGKFTGWIGYTVAWTKRNFPDLNKGNTFPAKYDRRHDVSIVFTFDISSRWTLGATWIYATGNALTLPESRYFLLGPTDLTQFLNQTSIDPSAFGGLYNESGARNSFRQKAYHRLDVSATLKGKKRKKFESSWNFSIFNVYNRYNPYFIYFNDYVNKNTGEFTIQAKQVSLFPILPSITYNFKF
ncbi:MAG TPA: TonB-dependent receptor [Bacteroidia bacterium]|nr:TonB-dependent receptor [Bacteroidia bacterium]